MQFDDHVLPPSICKDILQQLDQLEIDIINIKNTNPNEIQSLRIDSFINIQLKYSRLEIDHKAVLAHNGQLQQQLQLLTLKCQQLLQQLSKEDSQYLTQIQNLKNINSQYQQTNLNLQRQLDAMRRNHNLQVTQLRSQIQILVNSKSSETYQNDYSDMVNECQIFINEKTVALKQRLSREIETRQKLQHFIRQISNKFQTYAREVQGQINCLCQTIELLANCVSPEQCNQKLIKEVVSITKRKSLKLPMLYQESLNQNNFKEQNIFHQISNI